MSDQPDDHLNLIIDRANALLGESLPGKEQATIERIHHNAERFLALYRQVEHLSLSEMHARLVPEVQNLLLPSLLGVSYSLGDLDQVMQPDVRAMRDSIQFLIDWIAGPTQLLISRILNIEDDEDETLWEAINFLHWRGTREVFEAARSLTDSSRPIDREHGVRILGQLGIPERSFPEETFNLLADLLQAEADPDVLFAIGSALGHMGDPRAVEILAPLKNHRDFRVRWGVVLGIMGQDDQLAYKTLIALMHDPHELVRDWATFGLGTLTDHDIPEIREALLRRLTDRDEVVRAEALKGLAERRDPRVVEPLIREMAAEHDDPLLMANYLLPAAREIGVSQLHPALLQYGERVRAFCPPDLMAAALKSCSPR
jgi:hypothetical protein